MKLRHSFCFCERIQQFGIERLKELSTLKSGNKIIERLPSQLPGILNFEAILDG